MITQNFTRALASAQDQPAASFQALCTLADELVGVKLFTLTMVDHSRRQATRIFTNMPDAYPTQGTKPMPDNFWARQVFQRQEIFVANTIKDIAQVFFDHQLIQSLGCESVINIPVAVAGQVVGTINCLHEAGHYSPERARLSHNLILPGAAIFLLQKSDLVRGDH